MKRWARKNINPKDHKFNLNKGVKAKSMDDTESPWNPLPINSIGFVQKRKDLYNWNGTKKSLAERKGKNFKSVFYFYGLIKKKAMQQPA